VPGRVLNAAAVGRVEREAAVGGTPDRETFFMHEPVVSAALQHEVVELGLAAVGPVLASETLRFQFSQCAHDLMARGQFGALRMQHSLYFRPLPQGHRSVRPTAGAEALGMEGPSIPVGVRPPISAARAAGLAAACRGLRVL
jgi:hypothetical protein